MIESLSSILNVSTYAKVLVIIGMLFCKDSVLTNLLT